MDPKPEKTCKQLFNYKIVEIDDNVTKLCARELGVSSSESISL